MSGTCGACGTGRSGRFENLDCPVEAGEDCVMPHSRASNIKSYIMAFGGPLAAAVFAGLWWAAGVEKEDVRQNERIATVEKITQDAHKALREDLKQMNDKLDRLIERRSR